MLFMEIWVWFFTFLLSWNKRKDNKRKIQGCTFLPTPVFFYAKQKELASLKQLFVFNAPKITSASRQKSEANLGRNIASLVAVGVLFYFYFSLDANCYADILKENNEFLRKRWIPRFYPREKVL